MLIRYHATNPYQNMPSAPFVRIGELTNHYSTGTQYVTVYSDDPKIDILELLDQRNFKISQQFGPKMVKDGVECCINSYGNYSDTHKVYLLVPIENASINIGDRRMILSIDEVRELTLKAISES